MHLSGSHRLRSRLSHLLCLGMQASLGIGGSRRFVGSGEYRVFFAVFAGITAKKSRVFCPDCFYLGKKWLLIDLICARQRQSFIAELNILSWMLALNLDNLSCLKYRLTRCEVRWLPEPRVLQVALLPVSLLTSHGTRSCIIQRFFCGINFVLVTEEMVVLWMKFLHQLAFLLALNQTIANTREIKLILEGEEIILEARGKFTVIDRI